MPLKNLKVMTIEVEIFEASLNDKSVIENMLQLYRYDSSEFDGHELNEHGLFNYNYLDHYWVESERYPFLIRVSRKLAGFALLNKHSYMIENALTIAEFFIMRKFRRQGIGKKTAYMIFDKFPSTWEIRQTKENIVAQTFWKKIIREYTNGNFQEYENSENWDGPIQIFQNTRMA